jgi:hypothetical protein
VVRLFEGNEEFSRREFRAVREGDFLFVRLYVSSALRNVLEAGSVVGVVLAAFSIPERGGSTVLTGAE